MKAGSALIDDVAANSSRDVEDSSEETLAALAFIAPTGTALTPMAGLVAVTIAIAIVPL